MTTRPCFVFWDNANIFISTQSVCSDREGEQARYRIRVHFENLLKLAVANRKREFALAVGSIPPDLRYLWNSLENSGVKVELLERGSMSNREQGVDQALQVQMLRQTIDNNGHPGIAVLLTGDGAGFLDGVGFHADLERMHKKGWGIEVLAWEKTCNKRLREWAQSHGVFIRLENYYDSITFLEGEIEGKKGMTRSPAPLDLSQRPLSH